MFLFDLFLKVVHKVCFTLLTPWTKHPNVRVIFYHPSFKWMQINLPVFPWGGKGRTQHLASSLWGLLTSVLVIYYFALIFYIAFMVPIIPWPQLFFSLLDAGALNHRAAPNGPPLWIKPTHLNVNRNSLSAKKCHSAGGLNEELWPCMGQSPPCVQMSSCQGAKGAKIRL